MFSDYELFESVSESVVYSIPLIIEDLGDVTLE